METYNPDEQVQVLRQWLRENGVALVSGLVLGALLVAGWSGWKLYSDRQARQASTQFEQLRVALQTSDNKTATEIALRLTQNYPRTPYAALAALSLAAEQVKRGQFEPALAQYTWVAEEAHDRKLRHVGSLRRARLLWSMGRADEALAALQTQRPGSFASLFAELRGDIFAGQGKFDEARKSYDEALEATPAEQRAGIELKLNDLSNRAAAPATQS